MNRVPHDLYVNSGQDVLAQHVRAINGLVEERTYLPGYNVRARVVPGFGVYFEAEEQNNAWPHPWEVTIVGGRATVSPGLLNGEMPWHEDASFLRPLDGLTEEGEKDPNGPPILSVSPVHFNAAGYSWIVLRVYVDRATGKRIAAKDGGLRLAQTSESTWENGGSVDKLEFRTRSYGDYPLAMLRRPKKDTDSLGELTQAAMFHLNHRFVAAAEGGGPGMHFFWV